MMSYFSTKVNRADLIVEKMVLLELKSVETLPGERARTEGTVVTVWLKRLKQGLTT
jgi:hypothetical protein